jgi:hypothetical protein
VPAREASFSRIIVLALQSAKDYCYRFRVP